MKKLFIITIMLLSASLSSFSQSDTNADSTVHLKPATAIKTVQDLVRYDDLKERTILLQDKIDAQKLIIQTQQDMLTSRKENDGRYELVITNMQALQKSQAARTSDIEKLLKRSVRGGRKKTVAIVGALIYGAYMSLKRK